MLVAGPSHSTYHPYSSSSNLPTPSSHRRDLSLKSNGSSTNSETNSNSSSTSKYSIIKTFAECLNRGTELLKQTVQNAILPKKVNESPGSHEPIAILSPGKIHRRTEVTPECDSNDSIKLEMCHIKPIRVMPQTPKRRNYSSTIKHPRPKLLLHTPKINYDQFLPIQYTKKLLRSPSSAFSSVTPVLSPIIVNQESDETPHEEININKKTNVRRGAKRKSNETITEIQESPRKSNRNKKSKSSSLEKLNITVPNSLSTTPIPTTHSNNPKKLKLDTKSLLLQQEKDDYEYAKKLQNELNLKLLNSIGIDEDDDDEDEYNNIRFNSKKSNDKNKSYNLRKIKNKQIKKTDSNVKNDNVNTVRRSTRRKNVNVK